MAIQNRDVTIKNVFASNANTTIPNPPISGQSYRNTAVTSGEIADGWPYKEIVDSAKFNEMMYEYTTICKQLEIYGFLPWSNLTDYEIGSCCLATDGIVYQAKAASGPSTSAQDPVYDTSHDYWEVYIYTIYTASRALVSNASGKSEASAVTSTELGYLSGVTSNIQTQINTKAADNAVVHIANAETITGAKTFDTSPIVPTPDASDDSTKAANTAWVRSIIKPVIPNWKKAVSMTFPYTAPSDGWINVQINKNNNNAYIKIDGVNMARTQGDVGDWTDSVCVQCPVAEGSVIDITGSPNIIIKLFVSIS